MPPTSGLPPSKGPLLNGELSSTCVRVQVRTDGHAERELALAPFTGVPQTVRLRRL